MIYLLGVDHKIQHDGKNCFDKKRNNDFKKYLNKIIKDYDIEVFVEEFNEEARLKLNAKNIFVKNIAKELNKEHIFCDPNTEERGYLGINSINKKGISSPVLLGSNDDKKNREEESRQFGLREKFWFNKIKNVLDKKILMIVGDNHIESFPKLLSKKKKDFEILKERSFL